MRQGVWLALALIALSGCAVTGPGGAPSPEAAREAREAELSAWQQWGLTGRLGLDNGEEGGSGRLDWTTRPDLTALSFRGALGAGAWQLDVTPGEAELRLPDGRERRGPDVESLVLAETGWQLPVQALAWWVRGLPWPSGASPSSLVLNDDGTPASFEQAGWRVAFRRYDATAGTPLPTRLEARQESVTVKLAVSRWLAPGVD